MISSLIVGDSPNVEMMTHIEGPIVSSFYDVALLSWHLTMNPPLPLLGKPYEQDGPYQFGLDNTYASERWLDGSRGEGIAKERRSKNEPTDGGKGASTEGGQGRIESQRGHHQERVWSLARTAKSSSAANTSRSRTTSVRGVVSPDSRDPDE